MISRIRGTLLRRDTDAAEVMTAGGVAYELDIPLDVFERLPAEGQEVEFLTHYVVREDEATLYGFLDEMGRSVFARLLTANGVGPRLALNMLSTLRPERLVNAIVERDYVALTRVSGLGKKKAEQLAVQLADRLDDLAGVTHIGAPQAQGVEDAVQALMALGYSQVDANVAVRKAMEGGQAPVGVDLIKAALARIGPKK
ncbi:MAG: Holliday junction branch migration protein RuvA [Gemmatimonadota bacterium]